MGLRRPADVSHMCRGRCGSVRAVSNELRAAGREGALMDTALESVGDVVQRVVQEGFPPFDKGLIGEFPRNSLWRRMRALGTQLWLDTEDVDESQSLWVEEFSGLTTNNSLLNKQVQRGLYDGFIASAAGKVRKASPGIGEDAVVRELAFALNARHGLRLVRLFGAEVSVELHTDLADDVEATVEFGRRMHAICPERFIVKIPLTAAGLLAARKLSKRNVAVNLTLGFSARQNLMVCYLARPRFCNVFLGRLNQVAADNQFGTGEFVGDRALAASQRIIRRLRQISGVATRQIAASLRNGDQIRDLAGVDVLTMPPSVARAFLEMNLSPNDLSTGIERDFRPVWAEGRAPKRFGFENLWDVPEELIELMKDITGNGVNRYDGPALQREMAIRGFGDLLPAWTEQDRARARQAGKIPRLSDWAEQLTAGKVGLDALMTLHGLERFAADQKAMDDRIREHL